MIDFGAVVKVVITTAQVNAERDRRQALGFIYGGKTFQSDDKSLSLIARVSGQALVAAVNGAQVGNTKWNDGVKDFYWIAADNSTLPMDAQTMVDFNRVAVAFIADLVVKGAALKAMKVIPLDYVADKYWS